MTTTNEQAAESPTETPPANGQGLIHMTGYITVHGHRIQVDFQIPAGASEAEQGSAFLNALAQQDHVKLDWIELGAV